MNPNSARRTALSVGVAAVVLAGCSATERKVEGTAIAGAGTSPTTSARVAPSSVEPAQLPSLLASPAEVAGVISVDVTPGRIYRQPFRNLFSEPAICMDAVMPGQSSSVNYAKTGFAAQPLESEQPHVRVLQVVAVFASLDEAKTAYDIAVGRWMFCQDKTVTLTAEHDVAVQKTGRVETRDSITSIAVSKIDGNSTASCQHALMAKRNVVIDVRVCAPNVANMGRELTSTIAAKLA